MSKMLYSIFLIHLLYLCKLSSTEINGCNLIDPCKCEFENGTGIDLNPLASESEPLIVEHNNRTTSLTFYFNPCKNRQNIPDSPESNECTKNKGYSVCKYNETWINSTTSLKSFTKLGEIKDLTFKIVSQTAKFLFYKNSTTITLVCTDFSETKLIVETSEPPISLLLFTPHACLKQFDVPYSMSTGSTLVITFLILVTLYLGFGIAYKLFFIGASGIEVLPNLEFWQDLPSLVRDGARYIQNGCKIDPLVQNTQESYDAI